MDGFQRLYIYVGLKIKSMYNDEKQLNKLINKQFTNTSPKIKSYSGILFLTYWCNLLEHVCGNEVSFDIKEINKISEQLINDFETTYFLELKYLQSILESIEVVSIIKCEYNSD